MLKSSSTTLGEITVQETSTKTDIFQTASRLHKCVWDRREKDIKISN